MTETAAPVAATDPASAIAAAIGEGFKTIQAGFQIVAGRDRDLTDRNAYSFGRDQMAANAAAQRLGYLDSGLGYLQSQQSTGTKTLLIISSLASVLVISFALLHRKA